MRRATIDAHAQDPSFIGNLIGELGADRNMANSSHHLVPTASSLLDTHSQNAGLVVEQFTDGFDGNCFIYVHLSNHSAVSAVVRFGHH